MAKKGSKPKAPKAPDYTILVEQQSAAQLAAQRAATEANRINQYTPWGSVTYGQDGGGFDEAGYNAAMDTYNNTQGNLAKGAMPTKDQFTDYGEPWQRTTLDPRLQSQLYSQLSRGSEIEKYINQTYAPRVAEAYSQDFNWADAPEVRDVDLSSLPDVWDADWTSADPETGGMAIDKVQQALMSRMAPDLLRNREREEAQLIAQGVGRGASDAWSTSQQLLGRNETDASMQALLQGIGEYGNIRDDQMGWRGQRYGELTDQYGRDITDRNRYLSEQKARRDLPLEEAMKLYQAGGGQQVAMPNMPGFYQQGVADGANYAGAGSQQYGAQMDNYNARQAQNSNFWNSLVGLGMAGLMF